MDLDDAVDLLYGLDVTEFTARRDALSAEARVDGDRDLAAAIKGLRRPSVAAHAVNLLAREMGDQVAQLIDLGRRLQEAQEALSAEEMRALGRQRHQLIAGMAHQAASLARTGGHPISDAALREVGATLEAGLGDEGAASAVTRGRLVRSLSRTGLDPVDLIGAVAGGPGEIRARAASEPPPPRPSPRPAAARGDAGPERARPEEAVGEEAQREAAQREAVGREAVRREAERAEARSAAEWARAVLRREQERLAGADDDLGRATSAREEADRRVEALQEELAAARRLAESAADDERRARRARADAATDAESAEAASTRAQENLARLEGPV